jgi:Zn-dependent peptidase ImmA (M78 family)
MRCDMAIDRGGDAERAKPFAAANGLSLASEVASRFQTKCVFEIARKSNIAIVYGKWFPVTLGEFDIKNKRITVNENGGIPFERIIAHELGHYFLRDNFELRPLSFDEEQFCDEFADELLK